MFLQNRFLETGPRPRTKDEASSFYKRFFDDNIDEECYGEESCDFEEVVEKFGHSEQSVSIANILY